MPDKPDSPPCIVHDPAFSDAAAGAFFVCDAHGRRLLAGADNVAALLGPMDADKDLADLPDLLAIMDRQGWENLFAPARDSGSAGLGQARTSPTGTREDSLRYKARDGSQRWLRVRHSPLAGADARRLVFIRDETDLAAIRERLARAQSQEADASVRLQAAVLVNGPAVSSKYIDYACSTLPSKLVDGDFLDVMRLDPDSLDLILGDVMGKGMEAATLGTVIKFGLFRSLATIMFGKSRLPTVRAICGAAEQNITPHLLRQKSIATLTYGRLHEKARMYEFVDCGHTALVHYRKASDSCRLVKGTDMPLGFVESQDFKSYLLPYRDGDVLILYSDGLSECPGQNGGYFGEDRIMYFARAHAGLSAREAADSLIRLGFEFSEAGFTDDVSLIWVRTLSPEAPPEDAGPGPACVATEACTGHGLPAVEGSLNLSLRQGSSQATDRLRAAVDRALRPLPCLDEEERGLIVLACHEALANIIEHTLDGHGIRCQAQWRLLAGMFCIEFNYHGPEYAWAPKNPRLPIEEYSERGYGQAIMDVAMDSVLLSGGFRDEKTLVMSRRMKCWTE